MTRIDSVSHRRKRCTSTMMAFERTACISLTVRLTSLSPNSVDNSDFEYYHPLTTQQDGFFMTYLLGLPENQLVDFGPFTVFFLSGINACAFTCVYSQETTLADFSVDKQRFFLFNTTLIFSYHRRKLQTVREDVLHVKLTTPLP